MKALTICQPYAELIARGDKIIENRTWPTNYRGPLAIHAGKSRAWLDEEDGLSEGVPVAGMVFGAVVATADLIDCRRFEHLSAELQAHCHASGPWCWVLSNVQRINPVYMNGAQGLWPMILDSTVTIRFPVPPQGITR